MSDDYGGGSLVAKKKPDDTKQMLDSKSEINRLELTAGLNYAIQKYHPNFKSTWEKNGPKISAALYSDDWDEAVKIARGNEELIKLLAKMYEFAKHLKEEQHEHARTTVVNATVQRNDFTASKVFKAAHDHLDEDIKKFGLDQRTVTIAFFTVVHDTVREETGLSDKKVAEIHDKWALEKALQAGFSSAAIVATAAFFDQTYGSRIADSIKTTVKQDLGQRELTEKPLHTMQHLARMDIAQLIRASARDFLDGVKDRWNADRQRDYEKNDPDAVKKELANIGVEEGNEVGSIRSIIKRRGLYDKELMNLFDKIQSGKTLSESEQAFFDTHLRQIITAGAVEPYLKKAK